MAKSDDEYFEDILVLIEAIKANVGNLNRARSFASNILNICGKLNNQAIAAKIRAEAQKILSAINSGTISKACIQIERIIKAPKVLPLGRYEERCINPEYIQKTKKYLTDCKKYRFEGDIEAIEIQIQNSPCVERLHELITKGKWTGYRRARLSSKVIILYHWYADIKTLVYEEIITLAEFV